MTFKTDQEVFWAGDFGAKYIERNQGEALLASNIDFFSKSLRLTRNLKNCIEFGANIGMNIKAIKLLYPAIDCHAIEINSVAANQLSEEITSRVSGYKLNIINWLEVNASKCLKSLSASSSWIGTFSNG